jgi:hypothetical protein
VWTFDRDIWRRRALSAFGNVGLEEFPDLSSVESGSCRPTKPFAILPDLSQASASSLPQASAVDPFHA